MPEPDQPDTPRPASSEEEVFDYGDRTILQLRSQPFDVANEFGTMLNPPSSFPPDEADEHDPTRTRAIPMPEEAAAAAQAPEDPIARLEQKLDLALRQIAALQQRLESMDATLMKMLTR